MFGLPGVLSQVAVAYPPPPWDFLDIPSIIILDGSVNTNFVFGIGNAIATWNNNADSSFNATQVTSSSRPVFESNVINGLGAVRFNGTDKSLSHAANVKGTWSNRYSEYTVCMVVYPENTGNTAQIVGTGPSDTNSTGCAVDLLPDGRMRFRTKSSLTSTGVTLQSFETTTPGSIANNWNIITWSGYNLNSEGISGFVRINGGNNIYNQSTDLTITKPYTYSSSSVTNTVRYGGSTSGQYFTGYIADFRYIPRVLTIQTLQMIEGVYAARYALNANLPIDHPYKASTPAVSETSYYYTDSSILNV